MKKLIFFFGVFIAIGLTSSCNKTYVYLASSPYDLTSLKNKSVTIVGTDRILLKGFIKTFNEQYGNKSVFINNYINLFKDHLSLGNTFTKIEADTSHAWHLIKSFAGSKEDFVLIDSLFVNNHSDYILNIYNFEISNRNINNTGTEADGNVMSTRKEIAVVKARFQVIDRLSRQHLVEFEASGEKAVSFFNLKTALNKALLKSIEHAVQYIQSGETKFKK